MHAALNELRASHGVLRFGLVGFRLGATLAALAAVERTDVEAVVLWDSVVWGGSYLEALRSEHRSWRAAELEFRPAVAEHDSHHEVLGTPLPEALVHTLEGVALDQIVTVPAKDVLILSSGPDNALRELAARWSNLGVAIQQRTVQAESKVPDHPLVSLPQVPSEANQWIATWLSEVSL